MRVLPLLAALPLLTHAVAGAAPSTPCDAPERFVKVVAPGVVPLLRPYVVAGFAAVALREQAGERWLELAASSEDDVRRRLAGEAGASPGPQVATWGDRVWLRCPVSTGRT
jgi:hypothetical protein